MNVGITGIAYALPAREVATGELMGRLRLGDVGWIAETEHLVAADEPCVQDRVIAAGRHERAVLGGDGEGHDVGLLRRETVLAQRPIGHGADGVDVVGSAHPAHRVDRDEAFGVVGQTHSARVEAAYSLSVATFGVPARTLKEKPTLRICG